jgi:hypothetical protein
MDALAANVAVEGAGSLRKRCSGLVIRLLGAPQFKQSGRKVFSAKHDVILQQFGFDCQMAVGKHGGAIGLHDVHLPTFRASNLNIRAAWQTAPKQ